jgi:hypothetical protein
LSVTANKPGEDRWNNKPVASGTTTVTVPENSTPYSPVFVPDIFLKPVQETRTQRTQVPIINH